MTSTPEAAPPETTPVLSLVGRIPQMKDSELVALLSNARRLDIVGTPEQRRMSATVLPALELEASRRRETKLNLAVARRAGPRRGPSVAA
ncbi:hypothetical protein [Caulobacter sp. B11]|uniref:hypothetical protein n=1 Tax=Caulobacter sp. B11 TaxID=2048899 RepID=UPI001F1E586B|nr:hypothetical protein [Caulobacter sp. B11]